MDSLNYPSTLAWSIQVRPEVVVYSRFRITKNKYSLLEKIQDGGDPKLALYYYSQINLSLKCSGTNGDLIASGKVPKIEL